jgi:hypothetical protein
VQIVVCMSTRPVDIVFMDIEVGVALWRIQMSIFSVPMDIHTCRAVGTVQMILVEVVLSLHRLLVISAHHIMPKRASVIIPLSHVGRAVSLSPESRSHLGRWKAK